MALWLPAHWMVNQLIFSSHPVTRDDDHFSFAESSKCFEFLTKGGFFLLSDFGISNGFFSDFLIVSPQIFNSGSLGFWIAATSSIQLRISHCNPHNSCSKQTKEGNNHHITERTHDTLSIFTFFVVSLLFLYLVGAKEQGLFLESIDI